MNEEGRCNTTLGLGIEMEVKKEKQLKQNKRGLWLDLSLPLHPKIDSSDHDQDSVSSKTIDDQEDEEARVTRRSVSNNVDFYHNNNDGSRKKLKLSTEQITLLEDSFKSHNTLNSGQKQELAKKLQLLPRQIEVWFQNRRARTKLKQIEQECAFLRKCCETLRDENQKLKKELQDIRYRSSKSDNHRPAHPPLPLYIQYPTATSEKSGKTDEDKKTDGAAIEGDHGHDNCIKENATATLL